MGFVAHVQFVPPLNYLRVDLHGCAAREAGLAVEQKVQESYRFAASFLEIVHGTPGSVAVAVLGYLRDPSVAAFLTNIERVRLEACDVRLARRLRNICPDKEMVVVDAQRVVRVADHFLDSTGFLCRIKRRGKPAEAPALLSGFDTGYGGQVTPYLLPLEHRRADESIPDDFELLNLEPSSDMSVQFEALEHCIQSSATKLSIEFSAREIRKLQRDVGTKVLVYYRVRDDASYALAYEISEQLQKAGWNVEKTPEGAEPQFTSETLSKSSETLRQILGAKKRAFRLFETEAGRHLYLL